jgi:Cu(I)/Ag(I) efflux system protein CusF
MRVNIINLILLALLSLTAIPAVAEEANIIVPMDGKAPTEIYQGQGLINSVDVKAGKIGLSHGPIASLGMGAMTTNFDVVDRSLLVHLKKGQKVAFTLVQAGLGQYTVSKISAVK